uniref:Aminotransferase class I/classII domain-containing protein n=1 Tax=Oncorhynchus tshawytscha TaxID=74940 RepID=A0A8C8CRQ0_ONCTS
MNNARFLTAVSAARKPSIIRMLTEVSPSMISLAGGAPNTFPFQSCSIQPMMKRALQYSASSGKHWVFEMLVNPGDGLLHASTYSGTLAAHGMILGGLKEVLSRWDLADVHKPHSTVPRVLYTIPNGGNPTGASLTTQRKRELARQYDLLIIEDDPYYFLQFEKVKMVTDSFSKILSLWLCGPKLLVDRVVLHIQASTMHTSTFTQVNEPLLPTPTPPLKYMHNPRNISMHPDPTILFLFPVCVCVCVDVTEWRAPAAGMFLWIKLKGIEKVHTQTNTGVFMINSSDPCPYVRAAFSLSTPQQIDEVKKHTHRHTLEFNK